VTKDNPQRDEDLVIYASGLAHDGRQSGRRPPSPSDTLAVTGKGVGLFWRQNNVASPDDRELER
jgi:hypothetical protein